MRRPLLLGTLLCGLLSAAYGQDPVRGRLLESPRHHEWLAVTYGDRTVYAYVAYPERPDRAPVVLVIHENRGLTDWVRSVTDRLAEAGYLAVAPDLLSGMAPGGGRTADFPHEDAAREAIYRLPGAQVMADLRAVAERARRLPAADGRLAVAGFCWGGSQAFAFATAYPDLRAAFIFYGTAPEDSAALSRIRCPVYGFYGGADARVNATVPRTARVLSQAGVPFEPVTYEGAGHAFMRTGELPGATEANRRACEAAWTRWKALLRQVFE
ncbi:MAG: dienelactone hydrolase family protein [Bacteroidetes bacterium]|nr:dienelactone hydrolase family protein [Bacteroidota bacterium]MCX7906769.1 dienelactone hydrolase family protein [Bacteroidota bacterium]MDW8136951.1 dienelactone hydrolase family protein [Bacteroidota bacterium]